MNPDDAKKIIEELLEKTGITFTAGSLDVDESDGSYWYRAHTPDSYFFIGKNGETLQAINHLFRRIIEMKTQNNSTPFSIIIDINNYQKSRVDNVKAIAHMMAERARFFKSNIEIDPMTSFERRIIHTFLEHTQDLKTESTGEGKDRRVIIKYIGKI